MSVKPPSPLSYVGEVAVPFINKTFPPTSSFNKFSVPTIWVDTSAMEAYLLVSVDLGTAEWIKIGGISGQVEKFNVDTSTPPGTDPVLPDGDYIVTITGGQVASGTTADVIQTNSLAANTFTIQIQRSSVSASSDSAVNGVCHFNSDHFSINGDGFVSLIGGGQAIDSFTVPSGTSPVVPDANANIDLPAGNGFAFTGGTNAMTGNMVSPFTGDFTFTGNLTVDENLLTSQDRTEDIGSTTNAWRNVYADGISFDDGANTLNFYEMGTWVPSLQFGGASTGITYQTQSGAYLRLGNIVFANFTIILTSKGTATGDATIQGLPYTPDFDDSFDMDRYSNLTYIALRDHVAGITSQFTDTILLVMTGDGVGETALSDTEFANNTFLQSDFFYFTS